MKINGYNLEIGDRVIIYVEKLNLFKRLMIFLRLRKPTENGVYIIKK